MAVLLETTGKWNEKIRKNLMVRNSNSVIV
jgi:hypothetical protein